MRGIATKVFARGMNAVRLNQRNCGDTEHLSAGLFHSGLTADVRHVVEELIAVDGLPAIAVAGYSLGGNLALKLAGEYGDVPPPALVAVCAVSPIIEISECVRALERPGNRLYQWNFVRDLKRRMRRKDRFWPGQFDLSKLDRIRTVREFDEPIRRRTSVKDAEDYYHRASAMQVGSIRVPASSSHRRRSACRSRFPIPGFRQPSRHLRLHARRTLRRRTRLQRQTGYWRPRCVARIRRTTGDQRRGSNW
jgi:predicted alpha/beta-fold hydrolase